MLSPKAKALLRDSKKELLRYARLKGNAPPDIFIHPLVYNLGFHLVGASSSFFDNRRPPKTGVCLNGTV